MTDPFTRLAEIVKARTPGPWEAQEAAFCPNSGKARIWPLKIEGRLYGFAMLKQRDAEFIALLGSIADELVAVIEEAEEVCAQLEVDATEADIKGKHVVKTEYIYRIKEPLFKALAGLSAKIEESIK